MLRVFTLLLLYFRRYMRSCNLHCNNLQSLLILKLSRHRRRVLDFNLVDTCDVHAVGHQ